MRALIKGGPAQSDTRVDDTPVPFPGAGQVVLQVEGCGLCGSDVHAWRGDDGYGWVTTPVVMGHEVVGRVVSADDSVLSPQVGDRVVPISILGCGACDICATGEGPLCAERNVLGLSRDGGAAEFVISDATELVAVPPEMPFERAVLTEPLSVALHAIERFSGLGRGDTVGICGPGPVGLLAAWALRQRGIGTFVLGAERDREMRLPAARSLGIEAFTADEREIPKTNYWIEASGSEGGLGTTLEYTLPGGQISVVALFGRRPILDMNIAVRRQIRLLGSYASVPADYRAAIELLALSDSGLEKVLVTTLPLAESVSALEATSEGRVVKAVLVP